MSIATPKARYTLITPDGIFCYSIMDDHAPRARPEFDEMRRRLNEPTGARTFLALAVQQPSPSLEWRTDLTALTDFRGGWLVQPGGSGIRADRCSSMLMPTSCAAIASMTILDRCSIKSPYPAG